VLAAGASLPAAAAALAQAHGADITAQLAAQIASRAPRTAFDFALEPQGLGRVDVSLKFDTQGQLSAVLSFENPAAAAEARGRASDLHQALLQAGLDVSQSGLSFTSGGGHGQGAAGHAAPQTTFAPGLLPSETAGETLPAAPPVPVAGVGGLDITI
jgi:Meckel syndrome type 1 protein